MRHILIMTLAGSFLFFGVLALTTSMDKEMTHVSRRRLLVVVILTYLVPWAWMRDAYYNIIYLFQVSRRPAVTMGSDIVVDMAGVQTAGGAAASSDPDSLFWVTALWAAGFAVAVLIRCACYFHGKRKLLQIAESCDEAIPAELWKSLKEEYRYIGRPRFYSISRNERSLTLGVFRPVIVLQEFYSQKELEMILRHELTHIVNGDCLFKWLAELAQCVHWYNPLAMLLARRFSAECEVACDELVTGKCKSGSDLACYAGVVVANMKAGRGEVAGGSAFSAGKIDSMKRITLIMNRKIMTRMNKTIVAGVFALLLFVDSLTALAYPMTYSVEDKNGVLQGAAGCTDAILTDKPDSSNFAPEVVSNVIYDYEVMYSEGGNLSTEAEPLLFCIHDYQDKYYQEHSKNADGGCTVWTYTCKFCPKCGKIVIGELVSTYISEVCPH